MDNCQHLITYQRQKMCFFFFLMQEVRVKDKQNMRLMLLLFLLNYIILSDASSFDLILNIDGNDHHFRFVEVTQSTDNYSLPPMIILDDDHNPTIINSSSISFVHTYLAKTDENSLNIATVINGTFPKSNLLFATIQISNDSHYDIISSISVNSPD